MKVNFYLYALLLILFSTSGCTDHKTYEINLAGEWRFQMDSLDVGIKEKWFERSLNDTIKLPGSMVENGKGSDITVHTHWVGGVNNKSWFTEDKYKKYRQPGNVKIPFWLQPKKKYYGAAWYQKEVSIPSDWNNNNIVLSLERCHWETKVWIDSSYAGMQNSFGTPHEYNLTKLLSPGRHTISILVDNRIKDINPGINSHSISDHTQSNWNGIVGEIFLVAQPVITITEVRLFPNIANRTVKTIITINNPTDSPKTGTLNLSAFCKTKKEISSPKQLNEKIEIAKGTNEYILNYSMGSSSLLWDEFNPDLYNMAVQLTSDAGTVLEDIQFGMRSFKVSGTRFAINGTPLFLRGTLECAVFPKTGYPATDEKEWLRIFKAVKNHGLNHVRFHSWCPPEAAFIAADKLGIYLQVECSSWANQGSSIGDGKAVDEWLYNESEAIVKNYGNHPSFCLMAYGNEPAGRNQKAYLTKFLQHWKTKDDRRVYTGAAGWPVIAENEFHNIQAPRIQGWGEQLRSIINAKPPQTAYDWTNKISKLNKPIVSHEIGQWCVYPNFKEIEKYTGVLKAKNFEIFKEILEANHMGTLADSFLLASGKLQALCYKAEIEAAFRTPGFAGFQLLGLSDFPGQGTALVGVLDAFWEEKGYITPKQFRNFCNRTVPIARMEKRVFTNDETFIAEIELSSFEENGLRNITPHWEILDTKSLTVWSGKLPQTTVNIDNCQKLGTVSILLESVTSPKQFTLIVTVEDYSNSWDFWVYPAKQPTPNFSLEGNNPLVTQKFDKTTIEHLKKGGKVILTPKKGSLKPEFGGDIGVGFSSIFWNTAWTNGQKPHTLGILCNPKHPALAEFPTEYHSNWQWWDAMSHSNAIMLESFSTPVEPIVRVIDDWVTNRRLALIFEAKIGKGKLIVSSIDLISDSESRPEARQLLYSLKKYAASEKFNPKISLTFDEVKRIYKD